MPDTDIEHNSSLEHVHKPIDLSGEASALSINVVSNSPPLFAGTEVELVEVKSKRHEEDRIGDIELAV